MSMVDVVFFDAGETLLGPRPSWSERCVEVLAERGHDLSISTMRRAWQQAGSHFDRAADEGRTFSVSAEESKTFWTAVYTELLGALGVEDEGAPEVLYATFSDPESYDLFPDARPTVEHLRERGYRLGVISNFESWLRVLLDRLEVSEHFEVIVISGEVGWEKPDRRIFERALEAAEVEASRAMHVGDSRRFDAEAARSMGMHGVLIDRHGRYTDHDADYPRITSLLDLLELPILTTD